MESETCLRPDTRSSFKGRCSFRRIAETVRAEIPLPSILGHRLRLSDKSRGQKLAMMSHVVFVTAVRPLSERLSSDFVRTKRCCKDRVVKDVQPWRLTLVSWVCEKGTSGMAGQRSFVIFTIASGSNWTCPAKFKLLMNVPADLMSRTMMGGGSPGKDRRSRYVQSSPSKTRDCQPFDTYLRRLARSCQIVGLEGHTLLNLNSSRIPLSLPIHRLFDDVAFAIVNRPSCIDRTKSSSCSSTSARRMRSRSSFARTRSK